MNAKHGAVIIGYFSDQSSKSMSRMPSSDLLRPFTARWRPALRILALAALRVLWRLYAGAPRPVPGLWR